ncbi:MAG: class I SAM-dependent methyltransferase [Microcoleaceae cyanobacterium]
MFNPVLENPALEFLINDQVKSPNRFQPMIDEADEMYLVALENQAFPERAYVRYYFNGRRIFDALKQVVDWYFQGFENIEKFFDFASGYGRLTRFLTQEIPPEKIWVADILAPAIRFQTEQFQVNGIVSQSDPSQPLTSHQFDCILTCSFFSHMPEETFIGWMKTLYECLSPQGILLFSVHDRELLPEHLKIQSAEILFAPASESRSLPGQEYGTTYVGEAFVRQVVQTVSQGKAECYRISRAICRYQDLYLVTSDPKRDLSSLRFSHHPQGQLEKFCLTPTGELHLQGWVSEINSGGQIELISVLRNGEITHQFCPAFSASNSRQSWSFQLPAGAISAQDDLLIKTVNRQGLEWVFDAASVEVLHSRLCNV